MVRYGGIVELSDESPTSLRTPVRGIARTPAAAEAV